jgi:hypothetical protein
MLKKLGPSEVKAAFIDAVRKREIRPLGIAGERPSDLVFNAREVKDFLDRLDIKIADSVFIEYGQKVLGVNQGAIITLARQDCSNSFVVILGLELRRLRCRTFRLSMHPVGNSAKLKGITQKELTGLCRELKLELLSWHIGGQLVKVCFTDRRNTMLLGIH